MTSDILQPIDDETEFRTQLHRLLLRAYMGDIFIEGGWACVGEDDTPGWDVEIFKLKEGAINNRNTTHQK